MKILLISSYLPYPLYSGGQVRLYNLMKQLSSNHEITLICEKRQNQSALDVKAVEKICKKVITVDRRKQWSFGNILKATLSKQSFLLTGHTNFDLQERVKEQLHTKIFDMIHVETYYVYQNLPKTTIPVVLVEHNIEYEVYERYTFQRPIIFRPFLIADVLKIKNEERGFWKKSSAVVAVSQEDKQVMVQAGLEPFLVTNGVNIDQFTNTNIKKTFAEKTKRILFIGDFRWIQNKDSVSFIIKEIWPKIKSKIKNQEPSFKVTLWIVGRKIPESMRLLTADSDVMFDEESSIKPTPEIFKEAYLLLAPIRVGGGTSFKILEAMASGVPVVTTQLGREGIGAKPLEEIIVGETSEELADATLRLIQDETLYQTIARNARMLIEKKYDWKIIVKKLEEVYSFAASRKT